MCFDQGNRVTGFMECRPTSRSVSSACRANCDARCAQHDYSRLPASAESVTRNCWPLTSRLETKEVMLDFSKALLRLDARGLDDLWPTLQLAFDEGIELMRRTANNLGGLRFRYGFVHGR